MLFFSTLLCTFAPLIAIFALTKRISRSGTYFGVLLNDDAKKHPRIKRISKTYTYFAIITGCVLALSQIAIMSYLVLQISIFAYIIFCITLYFFNNRLIKNLISVEEWENMQKDIHLNYIPKSDVKNTISALWYLLHIVIIGATVFISISSGSYVLPVIQAFILLIMLTIHLYISKSNYFADRTKIEESIEQSIYFRRKWSIFIFISGLSINIILTMLQLNFLGIVKDTAVIIASPFVITIIITISAIALAIRHSK